MTSCCDNKNDSSCNNSSNTPIETKITVKPETPEGVIKAIEYYIEGGRQASSKIAKKGFAETAIMSWTQDGKLQSVPIQTLFDGFDSWQPTEVSYEIINCEVADDVAMVAINSQFGDTQICLPS